MYVFSGSSKCDSSEGSNPSGATSNDESSETSSQSGQGEVSRDPTTSISGANADLSSIRLPSISPLPELIVEREMDRHDESAEFYSWMLRRLGWRYLRTLMAGDAPSSSLEPTWNANGGSSGPSRISPLPEEREMERFDEFYSWLHRSLGWRYWRWLQRLADAPPSSSLKSTPGGRQEGSSSGTPSAPASRVSDRSVAEGTQGTSGSEAEGKRPLQHVAMEVDDGVRKDDEIQGDILLNCGRGDVQGRELEIVSQPTSTEGKGDGDTGGAQYNGTPSAPASRVSNRSVAEGTQGTSGSEAEGDILLNCGRGDVQGRELEIVSQPTSTEGKGDGDTGGAQYNGTPSAPASRVSDRSVAEGTQGTSGSEAEGTPSAPASRVSDRSVAEDTQGTSGSEAEGKRPLQHVAMEVDDGVRKDDEIQGDILLNCGRGDVQGRELEIVSQPTSTEGKGDGDTGGAQYNGTPSAPASRVSDRSVAEGTQGTSGSEAEDVSQFEQAHQQQELENKELARRLRKGTYSENSGASCTAKTHQVEKIHLLEPRSTGHFKSLSLVSENHCADQTHMENINVERVRCANISRPTVIVVNKNVSPQSDRISSSNRQSGSSNTHLSYSSKPHSFGKSSSPSSYETAQQSGDFGILCTIKEEITSDLSGKTSQSKRKAHVSDIGDSACIKRSKTMTTKKHISKNVMEDEIISSSNSIKDLCEEIPDDNSRPLCVSSPHDINVEKLTAEKTCSIEPEIMREKTQKQIYHSPIIVRKSSESIISPIVSMTSQKQRFSLCDSNVNIHLSKNAEIDVTDERMESDVDEVESVRSDEKYIDKILQTSLQSTESETEAAVERHDIAVQVNLIEDNEEDTPLNFKDMSTQTSFSKEDQSVILGSTHMNKQYKKTKATQINVGVKTSAKKSAGIDKGVQFNLPVDASTQVNLMKNKSIQVNFGIDKAVNTGFKKNKSIQICLGMDKCEQVSMYGEPSDKYG